MNIFLLAAFSSFVWQSQIPDGGLSAETSSGEPSGGAGLERMRKSARTRLMRKRSVRGKPIKATRSPNCGSGLAAALPPLAISARKRFPSSARTRMLSPRQTARTIPSTRRRVNPSSVLRDL